MDGRTRAEIVEERDQWVAARKAIAERGVSYTLPNGVSFSFSDLDTVQSHIARLTREIETHDAARAGNINPAVSFAKWRLPSPNENY